VRLPARDSASRRRAAAAARRGGLDQARQRAAQLAADALLKAGRVVNRVTIPDVLGEAIEDAALVTCWGRGVVARNSYGRREIDGLPSVEDPPRVLRQLRGLARGALALGLEPEDVAHLVRRVALDSMPAARRCVLGALADGEPLSTSKVAARSGAHRHVARRHLEELEVIGVVEGVRKGAEPAEDDPDRRPVTWQLAPGGDGLLIARVFQAEVKGWHKKWVPTPPPPQIGEKEALGGTPHFVPPPAERDGQSDSNVTVDSQLEVLPPPPTPKGFVACPRCGEVHVLQGEICASCEAA
jgi:hypothetical protein